MARGEKADWELYDLARDRCEITDRAADRPRLVEELAAAYDVWARRCNVVAPSEIRRILIGRELFSESG